MANQASKTTTDHETIRRWAEERGGSPAEVAATASEGHPGLIRIDFPGSSGEGSLRKMSWDEWFEKFDGAGLAFVYEDETADGQRSSFNEFVSRETAEQPALGGRTSKRAGGAQRGGKARSRGAARAGGKRQATRREAARTTRSGGRPGSRPTGRKGAKKSSVRGSRTGGRAGSTKRGRSTRRTTRRPR